RFSRDWSSDVCSSDLGADDIEQRDTVVHEEGDSDRSRSSVEGAAGGGHDSLLARRDAICPDLLSPSESEWFVSESVRRRHCDVRSEERRVGKAWTPAC